MRKTLLITSALGLMTAAPSLAMAKGISAGGPACGSHFFAQLGAKAVALKLEVKDKPGTTVRPQDINESADSFLDERYQSLIDAINNGKVTPLFAGGNGGGRDAVFTTVIGITLQELQGKTVDEVVQILANKISGVPVGTDYNLKTGRAFIDLLGDPGPAAPAGGLPLKGLFLAGATNSAAEELLKQWARDAITIRDFAGTKVDLTKNLQDARDFISKNGDALFVGVPLAAAPATAAAFIDQAVLSKYSFGKIDTIYYVANGNPIQARGFASNNFATALQNALLAKPATFKDDLANATKTESWFNKVVSEKTAKNAIINQRNAAIREGILDDKRVIHTTMAGGVGGACGYLAHLGNGIAASITVGGDYTWGKFLRVNESGNTKDQDTRKLGFAGHADLTFWGVVSQSALIGLSVGGRIQQFQFGKINNNNNTNSSSGNFQSFFGFIPTVGLDSRLYISNDVYAGISVQYLLPYKLDYTKENTNISKNAELRTQGIIASLNIGMAV